MTDTTTNATGTKDPLDDPAMDPKPLPESSTNPFEDSALLIASNTGTTADATIVADIEQPSSPQAQDNSDSSSNKPSYNPFDDESLTQETDQQQPQSQQKGSLLPMDEHHRDRYQHDSEEEDSVQSMLEMIEHKKDYKNTPKYRYKSLRNKARDSLSKTWRWTALGGGSAGAATKRQDPDWDTDEDDDQDQSYLDDDQSYDCIALSALKKRLRNEKGSFVLSDNNNENDDEESLSSHRNRCKLVLAAARGENILSGAPDHDDDGSKRSDGTHTTKNTHGTVSNRSSSSSRRKALETSRRRNKYVLLVASFLALVLLLGILVLSYSLYALRHDDTDGLSIFTKEFWKTDVPKTLLFWRNSDDDGDDENSRLDEGPVH